MLPYLKKITLSKKLDNVKFIGRLHKKYIPAVMERSDILVANYVTDEHLELYIPLKLIEYANSDTPIIIGARGDSKNFIEKYQLGIATSPSDIIGFKESIIKVLGDEYNHEPKTSRFREDYSIDNVIKNYNLIFKKNLKK